MLFWKYTTDADHYFTLALADYEHDKWLFDRGLRPELIPDPVPVITAHYETESKDLSPSQRALLRKGKLPKGDFPSFYGLHTVFSERAFKVLWPLIQNDAQVIPLQCEDERLFLIHVTRFVDGLDLEHSDIQWIIENKLISTVNHHVFYEEKLEGVNIFKVPVHFTWTFVSDAFKATVDEHDLRGLLWKPLP